MSHNVNTAEFDGTPQAPAVGDLIAKKYRVTSVVGSGGMGVVLAATHVELGQSVAIKVLTVPQDEARQDEARERFLREGRATAALVSDHVVRVYDVGTLDSGAPFMVMELLRGRDLSAVLTQSGALPIEHAADYVRQAADAIASAHAQGIVHRDLKPSNLFLTQRSDGAALIKVLDFGISKTTQGEIDRATSNLTAARSVLGTPFYMSPEQIRDAKQVDFRTDIWALGLILHELLTASPAFGGTTMPGICAAIAADPPAALRLKRPEVPIELEAIVLKCLEKDPDKRFQDVRELAARLAPYSGRPDSSAFAAPSDKTIRSSPLTLGTSERQDNPTISQPEPSGDFGTMASAKLRQGNERAVADKTPLPERDPQTRSAEPTTTAASALAVSASRSGVAQRSLYYVGAGFVALLAVSVLVLRKPASGEPSPAASLPSAQPVATPAQSSGSALHARVSFALVISANQPGAQVFEGDTLLGSAPLRLGIDADQVTDAPRTFTVKKPGFAPYTIVQGASPVDVRVRAELSPEPDTSSPAPKTSKPKKAPPTKSKNTKPAPPSPPSDIFMQR